MVEQIGRVLDEFRKIVSDEQLLRTGKEPFDRRVDQLDAPLRIDRENAIPGRVQNRRATLLALGQRLRQSAAFADDRAEHEAGVGQCEQQELEGAKQML